jgi:hypothetical protein
MLHPAKVPARVLASLVAMLSAAPAVAALRSVSGVASPGTPGTLGEVLAGGAPGAVAYSLANGFPLWYQDDKGLKLELCLDQQASRADGTPFFPCITAVPCTIGASSGTCAPISFPSNFGPEAFWWAATAFGIFTSSDSRSGAPVLVESQALLVLAHEAGFGLGLGIDGGQASFGRIRLRIDVPVAGRYRVTHPYGEVEYVVAVPGRRAINQTQDVGSILPGSRTGPPPAGDFTLTLANGPDPATIALPLGFPLVNAGIVSSVPTGIGPFLEPADHSRITALSGATYLADPGTDLVPKPVPVTGGLNGNNFLRIELLQPPPGFVLNAANGSQVVVIDRFQLMGKVFDDRANLPPVANDDVAATAKGKPVLIDVVANDLDPIDGATNVHGINPMALGLPSIDPTDAPGTVLLTRALHTARGGTVQRFTDFATGKTSFVYTPAAAFTGVDSFQYVVQDGGGLISAPATVSVTVEELGVAGAEYRTRTGKWRIAGTASDTTGNSITLRGGPRATLTPVASAAATGAVTLRLGPDAIDFRLTVDPSSSMVVTQVHLHVGAPGGEGAPIFSLYDSAVEPDFSWTATGKLTEAQRLFESGQAGLNSFADVVDAIVSGNAYVDVHTAQNPAGELRGQLELPVIGTAPVDPATGKWSFSGKSRASPGGTPASVNAISSNGVRFLGTPLRVK